MKKILYIDRIELSEAFKSKERFEALVFAVCVKLNFQNSIVYKTDFRSLKAFFKIGQTRLTRILKNGRKYGYINVKDNVLSANKLRSTDAYNYRLVFDFKTYKFTDNVHSAFLMKDVADFLRKQIILNYVAQQNFKENMSNTLASRDAEYCNGKQYKKAVKQRNNKYMNLRISNDYTKHNLISRSRFAKVANCSKSKAKRLVNEMCVSGMMKRKSVLVKTDIRRDRFNMNRVNDLLGTITMPCFLRAVKNEEYIYLQLSNLYVNRHNNLRFIY